MVSRFSLKGSFGIVGNGWMGGGVSGGCLGDFLELDVSWCFWRVRGYLYDGS